MSQPGSRSLHRSPVPVPTPVLVVVLAAVVLLGACGDSSQAGEAGEVPVPTTSPNDGLFEDESADAFPEATDANDQDAEATPDPTASESVAPPTDWYRWVATATNVVDGDSLDAEIEGQDVEIRLIGLNANEGGDCFGEEAGAFLRDLLSQGEFEVLSPSDDPSDPEWEDEFGRWLRYLYVGDVLVNHRLIAEGYAVARAQSDHPFVALFEEAEAEASSAQRGLWAADACGIPASTEVQIVDFNANAPGPDDENRNGEWVELANVGDTELAMAGWSVRDESTRHRYDFPEDFVLASGESVRLFTGASDEPLSEDYDGRALYWDDPAGSVWNNGGDTIFVLDPSGNIVANERYEG